MIELNLGVIPIPYTEAPEEAGEGYQDTGTVAEKLEEHYHLFEIFYETHEEKIAELMTEGLGRQLEQLLAGAPPQSDPFAEATSEITQMFKFWITSGEAERSGVPGTPTKASIRRRSARFKKGKADGPRPSFVDSSLFVSSATTWATET